MPAYFRYIRIIVRIYLSSLERTLSATCICTSHNSSIDCKSLPFSPGRPRWQGWLRPQVLEHQQRPQQVRVRVRLGLVARPRRSRARSLRHLQVRIYFSVAWRWLIEIRLYILSSFSLFSWVASSREAEEDRKDWESRVGWVRYLCRCRSNKWAAFLSSSAWSLLLIGFVDWFDSRLRRLIRKRLATTSQSAVSDFLTKQNWSAIFNVFDLVFAGCTSPSLVSFHPFASSPRITFSNARTEARDWTCECVETYKKCKVERSDRNCAKSSSDQRRWQTELDSFMPPCGFYIIFGWALLLWYFIYTFNTIKTKHSNICVISTFVFILRLP